MTWIRFDCDCPDDPLWEELAALAGCDRATAFLTYWTMVSRIAKAHPSGQLELVSDALIESWAGWRGKTGRWASAVRQRCQEPPEADHAGLLRGWWRNLSALAKQVKDAKKRRPALPDSGRKRAPKMPSKMTTDPRGSAASEASASGAMPAGASRMSTRCSVTTSTESGPGNPRGFLEGHNPNPRETPEGLQEKPPKNPRATLDNKTPNKSLRSLEGVTPAENGGVTPPRWFHREVKA